MKTRSDFVTNSSSSSFVIAMRDTLDREHLREVFPISAVDHFWSQCKDWIWTEDLGVDMETFRNDYEPDVQVMMIQEALFDRVMGLFNDKRTRELDDFWKIAVIYASNDSENILSMYAYCESLHNTDKVRTFWENN